MTIDVLQEQFTGRVVAIWRYPLKSMLGEELNATEVTERGLYGDRAYAPVDAETTKVVSAKNPRRWPNLFEFSAAFTSPPETSQMLPSARITLPDGAWLTTDQVDAESRLSSAIGRPVRLALSVPKGATAEGYWPDHEWLSHRDEVFEFPLPPGTFFDGATIHLVTTATLAHLQKLAPTSRFDAARFRPNFVIETGDASTGFVEDGWIGKTIAVGAVHLRIAGPCPRCVMTTQAQGSLPKDSAVLKTAVQQNQGNVGVYASVVRTGRVSKGDEVRFA